MSYRLLRQDARLDQWKTMFVEGISLGALGVGGPIDEPADPVRVTLSAWGREPSDFLERPCVVVSDAMRRALERAGVDNVQYFRADVRMEFSDEIVENHWVANVIGAVSCLDVGSPGFDPRAVSDLARGFWVDPLKACGFELFRLAEDRRLIVIGDRVEGTLRAAQLRGIVFQDTESYTGAPVSTAPVDPEQEDSSDA